jgi:hypothetical protein
MYIRVDHKRIFRYINIPLYFVINFIFEGMNSKLLRIIISIH